MPKRIFISTLLSERPMTFEASEMIAENSPSSRLRRIISSARYSGSASAGAGGTGAAAGRTSASGPDRPSLLSFSSAASISRRVRHRSRAVRSESAQPVRRRYMYSSATSPSCAAMSLSAVRRGIDFSRSVSAIGEALLE